MAHRLQITYQLTCAPGESAEEKALGIALEQTVELPATVIDADLQARIVGHLESLQPLGEDRHEALVSYPLEAIGGELTQCLNLLFGNISLKAGILVRDISWPSALIAELGGPGHGVTGLRSLCASPEQALLCTALKPMGLSARALAERAYQFARGGIDIIKDDHGLADQPDAPFAERLERCQEAVERGNAESGGNSLYFPNVTAGYRELPERLAAARAAGCRGVLLNAWVTGLDAMRWARDEFGLAIMAHPALTGSYFGDSHGIAPQLLLGDLFRLCGADAVIYPNAGGRFGFDISTCEAINAHLRRPLGMLRTSFPAAGGGMNVARAGDWVERYGKDTILLIGGSLYAQGDLEEASRALRKAANGEFTA